MGQNNPYKKARAKNDKWQQRQKSKSNISGPIGTPGMYPGYKPTGTPVSSIDNAGGVIVSTRPFPTGAIQKYGGSVKGLPGGANC
jgi:hypothetical protein